MNKSATSVVEFRNGREVAHGGLREPLIVVDVHTFLKMEIPPRQMVLEPWMPTQGLAMLYGWRGTGKTFLTLSIAYAVASGGLILDWTAPRPAKVVYLDGEMPAPDLQNRLSLITAGAEREPEPGMLNIITPDLQKRSMPDFSTVGGLASLEEVMPADVQLIILDSISSLIRSGVENEAESWQSISEWAMGQRVAGRSVLFLHHTGKSGEQRGTSKREDFLDTILQLKPIADHAPHEGAKFEVHIKKSRGVCREFVPIQAELVQTKNGGVHWTYRTIEASVRERIYELVDCGMKPPEISKELGIGRATVYRWIARRSEPGVVSSQCSKEH